MSAEPLHNMLAARTAAAKPTLHAALIEARKAIPAIPKTADNPFYSSKYAPLEAIEAAARPVLHAHGICLLSFSAPTDTGYALTTQLVHVETGQTVESIFPLTGATPQAIGAGMTYGRRYNLVALLDLDTEPDDDGNHASGHGKAPSAPQGNARPSASPAAAPQAPVAVTGAWDGKTCPQCGSSGSISQNKSGKNAGLWQCKPWEEKGRSGCWSKWTSKEAVGAAWDRKAQGDGPVDFGEEPDPLPF